MAIPATEIAQIQADAAALLDKSCSIQRKTRTADGAGSFTEVYATLDTVNAGLSQPTQQLLQNYDFLVGSLSTWLLRFPVGTDVQHQDHAIIDGQVLEIHVVLTPRSYQALLTVLAAEIK